MNKISTLPPCAKGKDTMVVKVMRKLKASPTKGGFMNQSMFQKQYSFNDEHTTTILNLLNQCNKQKLLKRKRLDENGKVNDPNYSLFHRSKAMPLRIVTSSKTKFRHSWKLR